jgi:branched-chain amino acid transport system substrate-binding protein
LDVPAIAGASALKEEHVRQRSILRVGVALVAASLALTACGGDDGGETAEGGGGEAAQSLKIGFMGDLTGENSGIVIPPRNGAQLAIDQYNSTDPETTIEMIEYDSQGVPEQATALAQQAINTDRIVGLIGPAFSGESRQVGPILEEGKIPSVTASATNPGLAQNGWTYWHRIVGNDLSQGGAVADYIIRALSAQKVFVIHDNQEYSKGVADVVAQSLTEGGVTVETDVIDPEGSDYASTVNKVLSSAPEAVFYGGYYAEGGRLLKQLREGGVTARFLSGDGSLDAGLAEGAGAANVEGAIVSCPCLIDPTGEASEASKEFVDAYKAEFDTDTAIYSAEGYDAASAFVEAIAEGNTDAESINEFLSTIDIPGVTKQIKFAENGEPSESDVYVYLFEGATYSLLGNTEEATAPA